MNRIAQRMKKNIFVIGPSGSGKTRIATQRILGQLNKGLSVRVVDRGKSYESLCEDNQGVYLDHDNATGDKTAPLVVWDLEKRSNPTATQQVFSELFESLEGQQGALIVLDETFVYKPNGKQFAQLFDAADRADAEVLLTAMDVDDLSKMPAGGGTTILQNCSLLVL